MASRYPGTSPAVIWILGYTTNNGCYLNFPKPNPDSSYSKIYFSNNDGNESYLNDFDDNGVKVWLQVEPGQFSQNIGQLFLSMDVFGMDIIVNLEDYLKQKGNFGKKSMRQRNEIKLRKKN